MWLAFFTCAPDSEPQLTQSYFIRSIVSPATMFFFSCISHTLGMEYGTVNVSTENVKYCGRNCFLIAKHGTFPQSLLEHCECQQEEHWMRKKKRHKKKQERAWRGSDGVCVCGLKDWKKRCQLIKHVQLRDREWRKGKEKGKEKSFLSPGLGSSQSGHGRTPAGLTQSSNFSVLSTQVHSMSSLINPLWKRIQSSSQENQIMWRRGKIREEECQICKVFMWWHWLLFSSYMFLKRALTRNAETCGCGL